MKIQLTTSTVSHFHPCMNNYDPFFMTKTTSQMMKLRQTWTAAAVWLSCRMIRKLFSDCPSSGSCVWTVEKQPCGAGGCWAAALLFHWSVKCDHGGLPAHIRTWQMKRKAPTIWALTSLLSLSACKRQRKRTAFTRQRRLGDRMDLGCLVVQ